VTAGAWSCVGGYQLWIKPFASAQEVTKVILETDNATVVALVRSDDEIREVSLSFCFFCLVFSPVMSWVWCFLL
jgi:hypothetical protein